MVGIKLHALRKYVCHNIFNVKKWYSFVLKKGFMLHNGNAKELRGIYKTQFVIVQGACVKFTLQSLRWIIWH